MRSSAATPEEYIENVPEDRKQAMLNLRNVILKNLPSGFAEIMSYGMISYVVPHSIYPKGYHCDPKQMLPYISIASQKNFIALYHMGIYADQSLLNWFREEFSKKSRTRLDMGKSCIRFKKPTEIPFELMGRLAGKMTPEEWTSVYESQLNK